MWEQWPTIVLSSIAVLTGLGNVAWALWKDNKSLIASDAVSAAVSKDTKTDTDALSVRVSTLELRHIDFRVEVAKEYVSRGMLETTETRLLQAIAGVQSSVESMSARLDRVFERPGSNPIQHR